MAENELITFDELNKLINRLWSEDNKRESLRIAIKISNELLNIFGIKKEYLVEDDDALDKAFPNNKFKNQKMELWFEKHPYFNSGRVALNLYNGVEYPIECNFFWLNESTTKAKIAAITKLTSNWEDSDLTRLPQYNVGIDFFLNSKANSISMVITNNSNLRVIEFCEKLSHTQIEILNKLKGCAIYNCINYDSKEKMSPEPQKIIHDTLWNTLELKEVNKKFYSGIADAFELLCQFLNQNGPNNIDENDYRNNVKIFVTRLIGRLLFIWFLRKKGIINDEIGYFDTENILSKEYYEKKLKILFFGTLNTPKEKRENNDLTTPYLNGGLFEPHDNDWVNSDIDFPITWFQDLYNHLDAFNFTTDESSSEFEKVAIDPEMLGRVFENLLATIVPETSKKASERKNKGAFYTPRIIVSYMCKESLKAYFKEYVSNEKDNYGIDKLIDMSDKEFLDAKSTGISDLWGIRSDEIKTKLINAINKLKVLDPACGSGAFPIGIMQILMKVIERLSAVYDSNIGKLRLGKSNEKNNIYLTKLFIISQIIYGSDIVPMAVEISRLRAWLSLIVDDKSNIDPLPNLDFKFVCANSLIPLPKSGGEQLSFLNDYDSSFHDKFEEIKKKYFNAHNKEEKMALKEEFNNLKNYNIDKKKFEIDELLFTWNPFDYKEPASFFDPSNMFNINNFDIIIGNPPYIHFEDIKDDSKNVYKPLKYKSYEPRGDIYTLFYEMGINNLKKNGILCYITSNKWMRATYGKSLRKYFCDNVDTKLLIDLGSGVFESATVDTNIILIRNTKTKNNITKSITLASEYHNSKMSDFIKQNSIDLVFKKNQPWVILNKIEQQIKEKIEKYGTPLKDWPNIKINRGILTGCNDAFIIDKKKRQEILNNCSSSEEYARTDSIIRPILRGRDIKNNSFIWGGLYLICTHNGYMKKDGKYVEKINIEDYPSIKKHLDKYFKILKDRDDQGDTPYNLRSCSYMDDFNNQKICWSDISKSSEFCLIKDTYYLLNTGYVLSNGPNWLINYLNSPIANWYIKNISSSLGDNSNRFIKQYIIQLPIPQYFKDIFDNSFQLDKGEINYLIELYK